MALQQPRRAFRVDRRARGRTRLPGQPLQALHGHVLRAVGQFAAAQRAPDAQHLAAQVHRGKALRQRLGQEGRPALEQRAQLGHPVLLALLPGLGRAWPPRSSASASSRTVARNRASSRAGSRGRIRRNASSAKIVASTQAAA